jgi:hypothetical protein
LANNQLKDRKSLALLSHDTAFSPVANVPTRSGPDHFAHRDSPYASQCQTRMLKSPSVWGNSAMSVWGKLAGAAAGLISGGPIGQEDAPAESGVAFTVGVIALGAKMAKADGVVTVD